MSIYKLPPAKNKKYLNHYIKLIEKASVSALGGYSEIHHVIPRSMGGGDELINLVKLSAREHYMAHLLLWKAYRTRETCYAFHLMVHGDPYKKRYKIKSSKIYAALIEDARKLNSGKLHPMFGKKHTAETKEKMRLAKIGTTQTKEHKQKRLESSKKHPNFGKHMLGKKHTAETREKMSLASKGITKNPEHIKNMQVHANNTTKITCPHCDKTGQLPNMKRWHFDNCKLVPEVLVVTTK